MPGYMNAVTERVALYMAGCAFVKISIYSVGRAPLPIDIWADNSKIRIIHVLVLSRIKHLVSMTKVKLKNIVFYPSIEQ